jgi:hypothetical protein
MSGEVLSHLLEDDPAGRTLWRLLLLGGHVPTQKLIGVKHIYMIIRVNFNDEPHYTHQDGSTCTNWYFFLPQRTIRYYPCCKLASKTSDRGLESSESSTLRLLR